MKKLTTKVNKLEHFELIRKWAKERGIITVKNEFTQILKLYEEFGELCGGVLKQKKDLTKDSIGDMIVVLTNLASIFGFDIENLISNLPSENKHLSTRVLLGWIAIEMSDLVNNKSLNDARVNIRKIVIYLNHISDLENLPLQECIDAAWNEIKDRKGKNVNGNFIKDEK